jgi:hypothetical protein
MKSTICYHLHCENRFVLGNLCVGRRKKCYVVTDTDKER